MNLKPISWQTENAGVPAIYNGGVPAEIPVKIEEKEVKKKSWIRRKVRTITWSDFFQTERNVMKVFRIIPHADVTNNNKRLWKNIYKMFEMYERPSSRLERNGFKFTFREKDYLWFDVLFKQVNGQKKIEFYVSAPEFQAKKLKRKIESKMSVTFREASKDDLRIPEDHTVVQDLKYLNHDIFSLDTNTKDTKTPISNIMDTLDELEHDGDVSRLSVCNEADNRQKWMKSSQWAFEKVSKGKVPQRASANNKRIVGALKTLVASVINEINAILVDTFQAISNTFFSSDKEYNKENMIDKPRMRDELGTAKISRDKGSKPVFKTRIRVASHSKDRVTRDTMTETLSLSMADLTEANELQGAQVRGRKKKRVLNEINDLKLSAPTRTEPNVNLVSTDEMANIALQMPDRSLQRKYADALSVKKRVEVEIPKAMKKKQGVELGHAEVKDEKIPIYMPVDNPDNFYRGYTFIGSQGAGKDVAIKNWVVDANMKHNVSFIIPDAIVEEGNRGMADGIRDALPPEKIIDLDLNDDDYVVPLDLTEVVSGLGRNGPSRFADEMIDFMQIKGLNRSEKYLTDAAKASGGNLYDIKRVIEDDNFRAERIEQLMNDGNIRLARELLSWGDNDELGNKCDAIVTRLNRFFGNDRLYDIFAQDPLPDVDFEKWMKEGKVVIVRLPNGRGLGEHAVKTLVHWVTLKTFMTRMLMNKDDQKNGCFVVFNEPEQYASEGLTKLMGRIGTEGRKERLGSIYAFHHWNKLPQLLQENLQGGGVQQFLFMNDHTKTFDLSKHRFDDVIPLEEAYKIPEHHAIISVRAAGEMQPAFICKMKPPVKSGHNNAFLTKRHARMYGRKWEELQYAL